MPISEKKKSNSRYIAKCDLIQIRPPKERGDEIRRQYKPRVRVCKATSCKQSRKE